MSDTVTQDSSIRDTTSISVVGEDEAYEARSDDEMTALATQFKGGEGAEYSGYNYVAAPAPGYDQHGVWHVFGTAHRSGYAAHAIAMHWLLREHLGVPSELVPHRDMDIDIERFPKDRADMLMRWLRETPVGLPEMAIVSLPPDERMFKFAPKLAHYVAFEASRVSKYTAAVCNSEHMSALWCVSDFTAKSYTTGGVRPEKIAVVRPPICDGPWAGMFETRQPSTDEFTFGTVGTWHARKGFPDLVRAYFGAFSRKEPVVLKIRTSVFAENKTINEFLLGVLKEIAAIAAEFGDDDYPRFKKMPRIRVQAGTDLSDAEIVSWLGDISCYVNPSYGEGLGIPPIWAMAHGAPVISSTYGAVADIVNEIAGDESRFPHILFPHHDEPVPSEMMSVSSIFQRGATWGGYEVSALSAAMRTMYARGPMRHAETATRTRNAFSLRACEPAFKSAVDMTIGPDAKWRPW